MSRYEFASRSCAGLICATTIVVVDVCYGKMTESQGDARQNPGYHRERVPMGQLTRAFLQYCSLTSANILLLLKVSPQRLEDELAR